MTEERVASLLRELVSIESVNLAYTGGVGEAGMADHVDAWAHNGGFRVERQEVTPGQDNVLVTLDVPGATETLLFHAHMDTVALAPMQDALKPVIRDGRLYGRGACDTKGSLAAMMVTLERLRERAEELGVNVALLAAVDEEHAFTGVRRYVDSDARASAAVVGEPTDLRPVIAHKGCVRGVIRTVGKAAHSSEPHRGVSAIDVMADVIVELRALQQHLPDRGHELLGSPTFSVGIIEGGTGVNIVAERCTITYDRRTLPGEDPHQVLAELDDVIERVRATRPDAVIERLEPDLVDDALDTIPGNALVQAARDACDAAGLQSEPVGVPYGSDASKLQQHRGIPCIVLGPGSISQAHGADEYVPLDQLASAVEVYQGIALRFRGA